MNSVSAKEKGLETASRLDLKLLWIISSLYLVSTSFIRALNFSSNSSTSSLLKGKKGDIRTKRKKGEKKKKPHGGHERRISHHLRRLLLSFPQSLHTSVIRSRLQMALGIANMLKGSSGQIPEQGLGDPEVGDCEF